MRMNPVISSAGNGIFEIQALETKDIELASFDDEYDPYDDPCNTWSTTVNHRLCNIIIIFADIANCYKQFQNEKKSFK